MKKSVYIGDGQLDALVTLSLKTSLLVRLLAYFNLLPKMLSRPLTVGVEIRLQELLRHFLSDKATIMCTN